MLPVLPSSKVFNCGHDETVKIQIQNHPKRVSSGRASRRAHRMHMDANDLRQLYYASVFVHLCRIIRNTQRPQRSSQLKPFSWYFLMGFTA